MIKDLDEALRILREACPSFAPLVEDHSFSEAAEALRYILDCIRAGQHERELATVFAAIDRVLSESNGSVRSSVGVALIEHTKRAKHPPGPEREAAHAFRRLLGPVGRSEWDLS